MILFLHNRYRITGGEERAVGDFAWLVREHMGEEAEILERESAALGRARSAVGMLRGGLAPEDVAAAVRRTGARVVHAHNVNPSLGWRGLAAARGAGARVVLHLHNYRLVCAVGTCFNSHGEDCTLCHARDTLPGVRLNCRGTGIEAVVYGAGLALWQRRLVEQANVVLVPSEAAARRLQDLRAPLDGARVEVVPHVVRDVADGPSRAAEGRHALVAARLSPEKGVDLAIAACAQASLPLVVAGEGPSGAELRGRARELGAEADFPGRVTDDELTELRADAALAIVPSRSAETFGLAAAEAMAAGVPVVASAVGALPELVDEAGLAPPGDPVLLADVARARWRDAAAGEAGRARIRALAAPEVVARRLAAVYG